MSEERASFTTQDGRKVYIQPVSSVLIQRISASIHKRYEDAGEPIEAPMYEITTAAGVKEKWPIDTEMYADLDDEQKAEYDAYIDAVGRMTREINHQRQRAWFLRGIVVDVPEGWAEEQRIWFGIDVPDDPAEAKLMYIMHDVLLTPQDIMDAQAGIMRISAAGAPEEELDAIEEGFRRAMAGAVTQYFTPARRRMDDLDVVLGTGSGEILGEVPERVEELALRGQAGDDGDGTDEAEDRGVERKARRKATGASAE